MLKLVLHLGERLVDFLFEAVNGGVVGVNGFGDHKWTLLHLATDDLVVLFNSAKLVNELFVVFGGDIFHVGNTAFDVIEEIT